MHSVSMKVGVALSPALLLFYVKSLGHRWYYVYVIDNYVVAIQLPNDCVISAWGKNLAYLAIEYINS